MSITLMSQVYATKLGNANLKAVAVKLADYAHDDGTSIFPALETVADHTELSKSTVQRSIRQLMKIGILELDKSGGGRGKTTQYRFNLNKLADAPKIKSGAKKNIVTVTRLLGPGNMVTDDAKHGQGDHRTIKNPRARSAHLKEASRGKAVAAPIDHEQQAEKFAAGMVDLVKPDPRDVDQVRFFFLWQYAAEFGGPMPKMPKDGAFMREVGRVEGLIARLQSALAKQIDAGAVETAARICAVVEKLELRLDKLFAARKAKTAEAA